MGTFFDKRVPPHKRDPEEEPPSSRPHRDTIHPQTDDPAVVPVGAKVDAEGIIHIGANDPDA